MTYIVAIPIVAVALLAIVAIAMVIANESRDRRRATCDHEWVEIKVERFEWGAMHGYNERWQRRGVEPGVECPRCGVFEAKAPIQWKPWVTAWSARK